MPEETGSRSGATQTGAPHRAWTVQDRLALHELGIADDPTTRLNRHPLRPRPEAPATSWWQSTLAMALAASLGVALVARTVFRAARPNR